MDKSAIGQEGPPSQHAERQPIPPIPLLPGEHIVRTEEVALAHLAPLRSSLCVLRQLSAFGGDGSGGPRAPLLAAGHRDEHDGIAELNKYEAIFGRDSLMAAWLLGRRYPALTEATVLVLAGHQGWTYDTAREEEPGRIPHEIRDPSDPIAERLTLTDGWGWPYYGSVDATPLFVSAVARAVRRRPGFLLAIVPAASSPRPMMEHFMAAVDWLLGRLHDDGGLLVSRPTFAGSIENQVWKDSWDAYTHADGSLARPPVASVEAQGLALDACLDAAELLAHHSPGDARIEACRRAAGVLEGRLAADFWVDRIGGGYPALGLDAVGTPGERQLAVRASNMGHLLASRALDAPASRDRRMAVVRAVSSSDLVCSAGIRTLGSDERRYRPGAYHNGSSWPWDTAVVAFGLHRHGFHGLAWELMGRVLDVSTSFGGFPEFARGDSGEVIGFNRRIVEVVGADGRPNRIEEPPQEIQAWTVAATVAVKHEIGKVLLRQTGAFPSVALQPALRRLETCLLAELPAPARGVSEGPGSAALAQLLQRDVDLV
jgi:glycogen debranching enzyme